MRPFIFESEQAEEAEIEAQHNKTKFCGILSVNSSPEKEKPAVHVQIQGTTQLAYLHLDSYTSVMRESLAFELQLPLNHTKIGKCALGKKWLTYYYYINIDLIVEETPLHLHLSVVPDKTIDTDFIIGLKDIQSELEHQARKDFDIHVDINHFCIKIGDQKFPIKNLSMPWKYPSVRMLEQIHEHVRQRKLESDKKAQEMKDIRIPVTIDREKIPAALEFESHHNLIKRDLAERLGIGLTKDQCSCCEKGMSYANYTVRIGDSSVVLLFYIAEVDQIFRRKTIGILGELYGAVLNRDGVLDMLRFHKFTIGGAWMPEFGNPDDPEDFKFIYKYSPLHNIKIQPGQQWPATLLMTADHDDRVVPAHTLKYIAQLYQTLQNEAQDFQKNPIMARVGVRAGHGAGKPTSKLIDEIVDMYSFLHRVLRMQWHD